jgi:hypothetical protein
MVDDDGIEALIRVVFGENNADAGKQFFEEKILRSIMLLGLAYYV